MTARNILITGRWLCSCSLQFSWDSHHLKACYTIFDPKTGIETKKEVPVCSNGSGPLRCPECKGKEIQSLSC